jgi:hypothetical protein
VGGKAYTLANMGYLWIYKFITIAKKKSGIWAFTGFLCDRLSEQNFMDLVKLAIAQLPLIGNIFNGKN